MFKYLILAQCVVSFTSDYLIDTLSWPEVLFIPVQIVKILIDNGTHSLTALICWTSVLLQLTQKDEQSPGFLERYDSESRF